VIQSDHFEAHPTVTVLLVSSAMVEAPLLRVTVDPDASNGLRAPSQIMVDKAMTVMRGKVGPSFGRLNADRMLEVERRLALFLGIAK
jgi:mRNA interferase MazF